MSEQRGVLGSFWYIALFIVSFFFFLYLTFPYGVLKESVLAQISRETGYSIQIQDFGPSLPLGFEAEKISVASPDGDASFDLESVDVSVSILGLFLARLSVDAELEDKSGGSLEVEARWSILDLIQQGQLFPNVIGIDADNFTISGMAAFGLKLAAKSSNDLVKPVLNKMTMVGQLQGNAEIDLVPDDPASSVGEISLQLNNAVLDMNDPNLNVAPQRFKKALIKAKLAAGSLNLDKAGGFETQDLNLAITGDAKLQNPLSRSVLDLALNLKLSGSLKENFGFLLSMVGGSNEGDLRYRLTGTLERPSFRTL